MKCKTPSLIKYPDGRQRLVSCGHCVHCWINRQLAWTIRIMLEASSHDASAFLTLTYNDQQRTGELDYSHIIQFLKRCRKTFRKPVRYFCCGEFGKRTDREHWHLIMFGVTPQQMEERLTALWSQNGEARGFSLAGTVTPASARYVAKYCLKSGPNPHQHVVRMSRRPGIGLVQIRQIGLYLAQREPRLQELPVAWRIGSTYHPLDKSSRNALAEGYAAGGGSLLKKSSDLAADLDSRLWAFVSDPEAAMRQQALALDKIEQAEARHGF